MGFRDISVFNQAMLAKQGWRLVNNPDSLVARVLKARYFHSDSFLSWSIGSRSYCVWKSIFWGREVVLKGIRCSVGDGRNIVVYKDSWIPRPGSFKVFSPICLPGNALVSKLMEKQGRLNQNLVRSYFIKDEADLILSIPLSVHAMSDSFLWHFEKKKKEK
ncbi:hypothetical protein Ddye_007609 [Dipteronia dyeriana]|uniref:Uncharacterized protein n=1 Tax=Dipteronia dyeriana TaxID=168575 RepID=A0AAE0CRU7_9ROSI|nr:hypothetical protein Ddye_007609 [Dipteronia dyeriana]